MDPEDYSDGDFDVKLINLGELMKHSATRSDQQTTVTIFDEKDKASKMKALSVTIPPGGSGPKLHYHTQRESWILILSGEGEETVDGKAYPLKANDSIFILANEKHTITNIGQTELKYLEIFTLPSDFIVVE
ncbi:MAG: cupin domain-containing protein [Candidatus Bathyarchaeota archaeon]|nr:cupin domain-containing protein [Candidatus Bathyarchaeota archaeon]